MFGVLRYINTRDQSNVEGVEDILQMVFVAFTQHCIQSTVTQLTHVEDVEDAKYFCTLYTGPLGPPGGKAIYLSLLPCGFRGSLPVSPRRQFC